MPSSLDEDVTAWIESLRRDEATATQQLWEQYYRRLLDLAARRLPSNIRREFDEEDVALSAIDSFDVITSFPDRPTLASNWKKAATEAAG